VELQEILTNLGTMVQIAKSPEFRTDTTGKLDAEFDQLDNAVKVGILEGNFTRQIRIVLEILQERVWDIESNG
jgi:hypothetical protein